ncbi:hypothetical protein IG631_00597 [Alternaria alternata]|jgi:hypothetical protein|nr:hypothetical protein IG631_00597 [Alternaria alternata]
MAEDSAAGGRGPRPGRNLLDNNAVNASTCERSRKRVIVVNTLLSAHCESLVRAWRACGKTHVAPQKRNVGASWSNHPAFFHR